MVSVVLAITYVHLATINSMKNDDRISHTNGISHKIVGVFVRRI